MLTVPDELFLYGSAADEFAAGEHAVSEGYPEESVAGCPRSSFGVDFFVRCVTQLASCLWDSCLHFLFLPHWNLEVLQTAYLLLPTMHLPLLLVV